MRVERRPRRAERRRAKIAWTELYSPGAPGRCLPGSPSGGRRASRLQNRANCAFTDACPLAVLAVLCSELSAIDTLPPAEILERRPASASDYCEKCKYREYKPGAEAHRARADCEKICIRDNTTWIDIYRDNTIIAWQRLGKASMGHHRLQRPLLNFAITRERPAGRQISCADRPLRDRPRVCRRRSRSLSSTVYLAGCDANPKSFGLTKSANAILAKLDRVMDHPFVPLHWW
jgi:hypothetical protein